jgi:hypothetical protein
LEQEFCSWHRNNNSQHIFHSSIQTWRLVLHDFQSFLRLWRHTVRMVFTIQHSHSALIILLVWNVIPSVLPCFYTVPTKLLLPCSLKFMWGSSKIHRPCTHVYIWMSESIYASIHIPYDTWTYTYTYIYICIDVYIGNISTYIYSHFIYMGVLV